MFIAIYTDRFDESYTLKGDTIEEIFEDAANYSLSQDEMDFSNIEWYKATPIKVSREVTYNIEE